MQLITRRAFAAALGIALSGCRSLVREEVWWSADHSSRVVIREWVWYGDVDLEIEAYSMGKLTKIVQRHSDDRMAFVEVYFSKSRPVVGVFCYGVRIAIDLNRSELLPFEEIETEFSTHLRRVFRGAPGSEGFSPLVGLSTSGQFEELYPRLRREERMSGADVTVDEETGRRLWSVARGRSIKAER
jgi:hypothetical protein